MRAFPERTINHQLSQLLLSISSIKLRQRRSLEKKLKNMVTVETMKNNYK